MKLSNKNRFLIPTILTAAIAPIPLGLIAAKCGTVSIETQKTAGYADQMLKLANKTITVAGAWSDARFYAKDKADNLVVIGATQYISNDGIQVRHDLKKGDISALQALFSETVAKAAKEAKDLTDAKATEPGELTYKDSKGKIQSIFKIYNHDAYSVVDENAEIAFDINGNKKKAYKTKPTGASEYIQYDATTKTHTQVKDSKTLKVLFIPSSDATLVQNATEKLSKYFKDTKKLSNIDISVSTSYNAAAAALKASSTDVAFLPVDTWARESGDSMFILQAGRDVQIIDPYSSIANPSSPKFTDEKLLVEAMNQYKIFNNNSLYINKDGTKNPSKIAEGYPKELKDVIDAIAQEAKTKNVDLPKVGFYRSYIYARKDSEIYKIVTKALKEQGSDWKLEWNDVAKHIIYGYTSTTSAASFTYPEQWFKKHFKGFKSFLK
ncbi:hypothetical protein OF363_01755 [Mycoplasma enhydrae]|uniref:hypothetical protein n=1 Tax=Mycoplasma enhydrae TaxID=2499220 RepID=UPI0021E967FB|nr:hypothetical protein [Mycoplasma enhydrae]MCV3733757.1 hypothetical protein [Mycoplasma enhydrae]